MAYSRADIVRMVREEDVQFIRMQFVDVLGQLKNVAVTASQLERALDGKIYIDGASIEGFSRISESDQYLVPDLDTFCVYPWRPQRGRVARLICDVYNPDGTPFAGDPRGVLKRVVRRAAQLGYTMNVGTECEFFLFHTDETGRPTTATDDEAGYFDLGPLDHGESVRREICLAMEELGFEIETSHHEQAPGQHEIDFRYHEALRAADDIMTFKLGVNVIAQNNGLHATFMPKPLVGQPGSGMHMNLSVHKDGKNLFFSETDPIGLSDEARWFIAGLMEHTGGFTALTNPLINSYKRLISGFEAPSSLSWSTANRSAMIRIPSERGAHTRIELRSPDPSCNPYLALAACLAAGLDGLERKLTPPEETAENLYEADSAQAEPLPTDLGQALNLLRQDRLMLDTLGPHVAAAYLGCKQTEWQDYQSQVTDWERNRYITAY